MLIFSYPTMNVEVGARYAVIPAVPVSPGSSVYQIELFNTLSGSWCNVGMDANNGPWFGFASADGYRVHFRRLLASTP